MRKYQTVMLLLLSIFCLQGCGGSSSPSEQVLVIEMPIVADPLPDEDTETDEDNFPPIVTLQGDAIVILSIGQDYIEDGAFASDEEDGDLSSTISQIGSVNTNVVADYLLRYQVTDSSGGVGEASRLVRVYDLEPVQQSHRQRINTAAELSYLEHLPDNYNGSVNYSAPIIIFSHGSGATGTGNLFDVECCGLPAVINYSSWNNELPFVILSPQRVDGLDIQALDDFIEYALANYQVDPQRVYLAGWSQGANVSLRYLAAYPHKVAAVVPIAGGWFQGVPSNVCDAADVPMWSFVGSADSHSITSVGIAAADAINNCNPSYTAKLTNYTQGTHFTTSLWPFIPSETYHITATSDEIEPDLYSWLQSHSK
jgi:predicted esterase